MPLMIGIQRPTDTIQSENDVLSNFDGLFMTDDFIEHNSLDAKFGYLRKWITLFFGRKTTLISSLLMSLNTYGHWLIQTQLPSKKMRMIPTLSLLVQHPNLLNFGIQWGRKNEERVELDA